MLTVSDLFDRFYLPLRLAARSPATIADMRSFCHTWDHTVGPVPLSQITEEIVCGYLASITKRRSPATANKHRGYLLAMLRLASKKKLAAFDWTGDVRKLPEPRRVPRAYSLREIERLLCAARDLPGTLGDCPASLWMIALLLTLYDTGLRIGAALSILTSDVDLAEKSLLVHAEAQKQNADQWFRLSDQTVSAVAAIWCPHREFLFPWPFARITLHRWFLRLAKSAGVPAGGTSGCFHRLRKSCASYANAAGADATAQLGHSGPAVTSAYLDPRICHAVQAADVLPRPAMPSACRQLLLFPL